MSYRDRVYGSYNSGRVASLAPDSLDGLKPRAPYLRKLVKSHFPDDHRANILDLGCGHGALIHFAKQSGYSHIHGVDTSSEQVEAARKLGINEVSHGDLLTTVKVQPDNSVDVVICFDVLEHFDRTEGLVLMDEVLRVLKSGGRWIIHTVNAESPFGLRMRYLDITHEIAFTRTSIAQLLLSSGFTNVESFEEQPVPHGLKSTIRWISWKFLRILLRTYLAVETGDTGKGALFTQNFLTVATK